MSDFEFISIILSIVVGLTITRVLGGLASIVEHRGQLRMNWFSVGWAITVALWSMAFWLGTINDTRSLESWTVGSFGILLLMAVGLYFMAAIALPSRIQPGVDLVTHFEAVRRPFFAMFAVWVALTTLSVLIWGVENLIRSGPPFWIGQTGSLAMALLGFATRNRLVHAAILIASLFLTLGLILIRMYVI